MLRYIVLVNGRAYFAHPTPRLGSALHAARTLSQRYRDAAVDVWALEPGVSPCRTLRYCNGAQAPVPLNAPLSPFPPRPA